MDLSLLQAASFAINRRQSIYVPGCYEAQLQTVRQAYFPEEALLSFTSHGIHWRIIIRRFFTYGIPVAALWVLISKMSTFSITIAFVWLILILITSYFYYKNWVFQISTEGLHTTKGIIGRSSALLKWHKVQSIKIRQSVFQKRRNLADIYFYTAAGDILIPYVDFSKALAIKNYVLYKVETSNKQWM